MSLPFPRTYADLEAAPWCELVERPRALAIHRGEGVFIHARLSWLPGADYDLVRSAHGLTLKEALSNLRQDLWHWLRDPATGDPVSSRPWAWPHQDDTNLG